MSSGQSLFKWHADNRVFPNEKLKPEDTKRVGYFVLHEGNWWLVNERLTEMVDINKKQPVPIGGKVKLEQDAKILLQKGEGGRLLMVQMAGV